MNILDQLSVPSDSEKRLLSKLCQLTKDVGSPAAAPPPAADSQPLVDRCTDPATTSHPPPVDPRLLAPSPVFTCPTCNSHYGWIDVFGNGPHCFDCKEPPTASLVAQWLGWPERLTSRTSGEGRTDGTPGRPDDDLSESGGESRDWMELPIETALAWSKPIRPLVGGGFPPAETKRPPPEICRTRERPGFSDGWGDGRRRPTHPVGCSADKQLVKS